MLDVLFEDNHMLVLNKPSGLLTQPSGTAGLSLETLAKEWLKKKYQKQGSVFLEAIHRLDKSASGIVVFAKTSKALSRLTEEIRKKRTKKFYRALVKQAPIPSQGELKSYLLHEPYRARVANKCAPGAKAAEMRYRILRQQGGQTLLEVELITGRYHQIRAQLASIGSPILGDRKYGSVVGWSSTGIALHHFHFEILHPITKKLMTFEVKEGF